MALLRCDQREKNILNMFPKKDYILIETLQVGDYAITEAEEIKYLFERKTWKDLSASIKDGRYLEQQEKLKTISCPIFYIIEGRMRYKDDVLIDGIEFYKLEAAMRKLMMNGFSIVRTKDPEHTIDFLVKFVEQYQPTIGGEELRKLHTKAELTDEDVKARIFRSIAGVGPTLLPTLMSYSFLELLKMSAEELRQIKYTSGRSIGRTAEKIYYSLRSNHILQSFPGLSKKSAEFIHKTYTLEAFLKSKIEDVMKSEKTRIGPATAKKIIYYINFKK